MSCRAGAFREESMTWRCLWRAKARTLFQVWDHRGCGKDGQGMASTPGAATGEAVLGDSPGP